MYFELTEEQLAVREAAREFAQKELKPGVIERDSKMQYPAEQVRQMAELGFLGMMASPDYGGGGMDEIAYGIIMQELERGDSGIRSMASASWERSSLRSRSWPGPSSPSGIVSPSVVASPRSPSISSSAATPVSESCPNSVAPICRGGAPGGDRCPPEDATWMHTTVSVSTHASMIGSQ